MDARKVPLSRGNTTNEQKSTWGEGAQMLWMIAAIQICDRVSMIRWAMLVQFLLMFEPSSELVARAKLMTKVELKHDDRRHLAYLWDFN